MAYFFERPDITKLTTSQQAALNELDAVAISGGPGTGKSLISLWRHIINYDMGRSRSLLLTYTKTLEAYFKLFTISINKEAGNAISRTYLWTQNNKHDEQHYDEIIVDEAQDVDKNKYLIIKQHTKIVSYTADDQQILYPEHATTQMQLAEILPNNKNYMLDDNFRNSYHILLFVKALFPNKVISQTMIDAVRDSGDDRIGNKPIIISLNNKLNKQGEQVVRIINRFKTPTHNIGILVPFVNDVFSYANLLQESGFQFSSYPSDVNVDLEICNIENIHITTFKSAKGAEFHTVIIPNFHDMLYNISNMRVVDDNDYYVAITRARNNLFLICKWKPIFLERSNAQKSTYDVELV